ncbi:probable salivary secreted peptide [Hylaeus volcanicus]|uniref:probable salivary secreted peptide n=1 Tax=Hylaeus volcanicus TaxID=313075 RepID=UPI0023B84360|nr:probable salivary secreted peptide [Hylaeus volcanicus]
MAQKFVVLLAVVALAVLTTEVSSAALQVYGSGLNKSHNLLLGVRKPGDRLVLRQNVVKNSSFMQIVVDEKSFNTPMYEQITAIQVLDQKTDGNGAYASIVSGGPGSNSVSLRFKSQRGHGINFIVEVYAR